MIILSWAPKPYSNYYGPYIRVVLLDRWPAARRPPLSSRAGRSTRLRTVALRSRTLTGAIRDTESHRELFNSLVLAELWSVPAGAFGLWIWGAPSSNCTLDHLKPPTWPQTPTPVKLRTLSALNHIPPNPPNYVLKAEVSNLEAPSRAFLVQGTLSQAAKAPKPTTQKSRRPEPDGVGRGGRTPGVHRGMAKARARFFLWVRGGCCWGSGLCRSFCVGMWSLGGGSFGFAKERGFRGFLQGREARGVPVAPVAL